MCNGDASEQYAEHHNQQYLVAVMCREEGRASGFLLSSRLSPSHFPLFIVTCILLLNACNAPPQNDSAEITGETMGSTFAVIIPELTQTGDRAEVEKKINLILDEINQSMSTYIPESELSRINTSDSTDWISISPQLYEVLAAAQDVSQMTNGAFDITVGALVNLWGFGPEPGNQEIPDASAVGDALQWVGYQNIELQAYPAAVKKRYARTYLDLSGIASGYAADRIAGLLDSKNITNYMVDISGEIRARGKSGQNQTWRIGIEKPLVDRRSVQTVVALDNTGLTTAGDYRNFFEFEGKRYSHTIDPATGWPVSHNLASVTVLDDSAMYADALDTAMMVMGPELAYKFAEAEKISALFIIRQGEEFIQKVTSPLASSLVE